MSIGKNSILRVQNAEKTGAAAIVTEAPDMENSTVNEEPKATPKKTAMKKAAPKKTAAAKSTKSAPKKNAPKKAAAPKKEEKENALIYCQIGDEMPVYLL